MELVGGLLLDAKDDGVGASDADGGVALAYGFEGVFDLEEVAVRREYGDRSVVPRHVLSLSLVLLTKLFSPESGRGGENEVGLGTTLSI